jgi:transglutaminase-like putative cysteine protease
VVQPTPAWSTDRLDYFGNPVSAFTITKGHKKLKISSCGEFEVAPRPAIVPADSEAWDDVRDLLPKDCSPLGLERYQFCFSSPHIPNSTDLAEYALPSFAGGRSIVEATMELTRRIYGEFTYDPKATSISTPVAEVLQKRRGVCQDLAHLQIGCLRSLGLAARYVSGYLRTIPPEGKPRLIGADASHAWLSVYCGKAGWIDFDPTNDMMPSTDHITIAWGRDYSDVCPINGVFVGGGNQTISVAVDVETI